MSNISIIPSNKQTSEVSNIAFANSAPSAPGLIDTLRAQGPVSIASKINNRHPIESRILNWEENQEKMKMETRRRMFGIADPIKREMELALVTDFRPIALGGASNIHSDILKNKDWSVDWEDIYTHSSDQLIHHNTHDSIHSQMERKFNI